MAVEAHAMRWLSYFDPGNPQEAAEHVAVVQRIDAWWKAFAAKTGDLDDLFASGLQWDLPAWMHEHLDAINPHLMWEFGPAVSGEGHRLVITPEAERHLRPMVDTILELRSENRGLGVLSLSSGRRCRHGCSNGCRPHRWRSEQYARHGGDWRAQPGQSHLSLSRHQRPGRPASHA